MKPEEQSCGAGAKAERIGAYAFMIVFCTSLLGGLILTVIERDIWNMILGVVGIFYGAIAYVFALLFAKSYYIVFKGKKK